MLTAELVATQLARWLGLPTFDFAIIQVTAVAKLRTINKSWVQGLIGAIPAAWQVDEAGRVALATQIYDRAHYTNETFATLLERQLT